MLIEFIVIGKAFTLVATILYYDPLLHL